VANGEEVDGRRWAFVAGSWSTAAPPCSGEVVDGGGVSGWNSDPPRFFEVGGTDGF
jgi:hypothetical protein